MNFLKVLALFPVYLLHLCDGMNSGYPAILTPQLREDCSEFKITPDDESWIGIQFLSSAFSEFLSWFYFLVIMNDEFIYNYLT